jgi:hypothetical protein
MLVGYLFPYPHYYGSNLESTFPNPITRSSFGRDEGEGSPRRERTLGERLDPTLQTAIIEKDKYAFKAKLTEYVINGLQILFGTLTTGLVVVVTRPRVGLLIILLFFFLQNFTKITGAIANCSLG